MTSFIKYELDESNYGGIMRKILYIMIGCISLGLGIIGVILPILPTVPFVLLAAFCFAKSSEKLEDWFKNTKLYRENNIKSGMTKQAKVRIMCSVTLLMSIGFIMMGLKGIVVGNIVLLIVWIFHMVYFTFGVKTV
jgi:uncharacterized membrane protein YbaN (DUF454 family)